MQSARALRNLGPSALASLLSHTLRTMVRGASTADDLGDDFAGIPDAVDDSVDVSQPADTSTGARTKSSKRSKAAPASLKRNSDAQAAPEPSTKKRVRELLLR